MLPNNIYKGLTCIITAVCLITQIQGLCILSNDPKDASAKNIYGYMSRYTMFSCTPCERADFEVHIINMYQPTGSRRGFRQPPTDVKTVSLSIQASKPTNIKLLLMTYEAAHWSINISSFVNIKDITLASYYNYYSSVKVRGKNSTSVKSVKEYISGWNNARRMETFAKGTFGFITSYTGVYETSGWALSVGNCTQTNVLTTPRTTAASTTTKITPTEGLPSRCSGLKFPRCWRKYDFKYTSTSNLCNGEMYVTTYSDGSQNYYVGAILCWDSRYKLLMSLSLQGIFRDIGASFGRGNDHCQLVGMDQTYLPYSRVGPVRLSTVGFYRSNWGRKFMSNYIHRNVPKWYECGILIPSSKVVILPTPSHTTRNPYEKNQTGSSSSVPFIVIALAVVGILAVILGCMSKRSKSHNTNHLPSWRNEPRIAGTTVPPTAPSAVPEHSNNNLRYPTVEELTTPTRTAGLGDDAMAAATLDNAAPPSYEDALFLSEPSMNPLPPKYSSVSHVI